MTSIDDDIPFAAPDPGLNKEPVRLGHVPKSELEALKEVLRCVPDDQGKKLAEAYMRGDTITESLISRPDLLHRGWTRAMVKKFLPEAVAERHGTGRTTYWLLSRVEVIEATDECKAARAKAAARWALSKERMSRDLQNANLAKHVAMEALAANVVEQFSLICGKLKELRPQIQRIQAWYQIHPRGSTSLLGCSSFAEFCPRRLNRHESTVYKMLGTYGAILEQSEDRASDTATARSTGR